MLPSNIPAEGGSKQTVAAEFALSEFASGPIPKTTADYSAFNDDVRIERYRKAPNSCYGTRLRGVAAPFPPAPSYGEHIKAALHSPFPPRGAAPFPTDLEWPLEFNRGEDLATVKSPRSKQMRLMRTISGDRRPIAEMTYLSDPSDIIPAAGRIHIALLSRLLGFARMGGDKRVA